MDFLSTRKQAGFDRFDTTVLALYAAVLAFAIYHHLAWGDEAQAWLIARDSSMHELLFRRLHYEGVPALWPLILWTAIRLHLPYAGINWIGAAFAIAGIFLLLRFSPFPRIFRWLLPFTFFLQYQYGVIARPYVLFPVLIFSLCIVYSLSPARPLPFAVIGGLLANVSPHGAIFACLFATLYFRDLLLDRRPLAGVSRRSIMGAATVFALMCMLAVAVAFPAPDVAFAVNRATSKGMAHTVLLRLLPEEHLPSSAPPLDPPLRPPLGENTDRASGAQGSHTVSSIILALAARIMLSFNSAAYSISTSNVLAAVFVFCWSRWLCSRQQARLVITVAVGIFLCAMIWVYTHHTGLFAVCIIASVWITLRTPTRERGASWIQPAFVVTSLIVIVLQIGWTAHCIRAETQAPYDPGRETEKFLVQNYSGKRIVGFTFETVSTQPYAPHNLYINWPRSYWVWSSNVIITQRRTEALAMHPDVVVVGDFIAENEDVLNQIFTILPPGTHLYAEMLDFWRGHGYRETHRFCGDRYIRMGVGNTLCEVILEPAPALPSALEPSLQQPR